MTPTSRFKASRIPVSLKIGDKVLERGPCDFPYEDRGRVGTAINEKEMVAIS